MNTSLPADRTEFSHTRLYRFTDDERKLKCDHLLSCRLVMGASSSISSFTQTFSHPHPSSSSSNSIFTPQDILLCEQTWNHLLNPDNLIHFPQNQEMPPNRQQGQEQPINANPRSQPKSLWLHFYSLCWECLKLKVEENQRTKNLSPLENPNSLHTIMLFMLKLISLFLTSLKSQTPFQKYARSLSLNSSHLGISPDDFSSFESAFLQSIQILSFEEQALQTWKKMFSHILLVVVPLCQDESLSTKRPLRSGGRSQLRDAPESEVLAYFADFAFKMIIPVDEEEDPYSVNTRLSTSLNNSVEF
jgi:hypothetical protein